MGSVWGLGFRDFWSRVYVGSRILRATGFCQIIISIVEARKLEHSFRRISARIPYTLP